MRGINIPPLPALEKGVDPGALLRERLNAQEVIYLRPATLLLAYMLYPNDEGRRDQFVAAEEPVRQRYLEHVGEHDPTFFERFGGVEILGDATRELLHTSARKVAEKEWTRAGRMLRLVADLARDERTRDLRGGASLSKAISILENKTPRIQESSLKRAWNQHRDVAHFLAAAEFLTERANTLAQVNDPIAGYADVVLFAPEALLSISWAYQVFGLSYRAETKQEPLLNPDSAWRIPEWFELTPTILPEPQLTDSEVQVLAA